MIHKNVFEDVASSQSSNITSELESHLQDLQLIEENTKWECARQGNNGIWILHEEGRWYLIPFGCLYFQKMIIKYRHHLMLHNVDYP